MDICWKNIFQRLRSIQRQYHPHGINYETMVTCPVFYEQTTDNIFHGWVEGRSEIYCLEDTWDYIANRLLQMVHFSLLFF